MSNLQTLSGDELVTASGGDFRGITFGAFAALNAFGGDPSNSLARLMANRPGIVRINPGPGQSGGSNPFPFTSYSGTVTARFGY